MVKTCFCLVPLLCQLWGLHAALLDSLVSQSNIYYLQPETELPLQSVDQVATVDSVKLIVHGYLASRSHGSIMPLRNAYSSQGYENVLVADWSPAASLDYPSSRFAVGKVSLVLAKELQRFLLRHSITTAAVHVVGHSLGAHIAGRIGHYFNGTLGRVTGLDPALPLFTQRSEDSLRSNAAQFVDVIHTDYPLFGDLRPRGTVDFYPNFGFAPQPGCEDVDLIAASKLLREAYSCSHNRAVMFYAESIGMPQNFPAIPCSLKAIKSRHVDSCLRESSRSSHNGTKSEKLDDSEVVFMGEQVSRSVSGYFYLETNGAPPYGKGRNSKYRPLD
ncbi:lipase member H-A isoform X1 [Drosophila subobscura]|uniref:lipase member H-A isoform X1 n=1 Tax=Drosophila subobscura TaxID=7241 RepID=UPI00155AD33B|nr:lipase member H-A isoform X1 [Drosophila subobscura]